MGGKSTARIPTLLTLLNTGGLPAYDEHMSAYVVAWLPVMNILDERTHDILRGRCPCSMWFPWKVLDTIVIPLSQSQRGKPDKEWWPATLLEAYECRSLFTIRLNRMLTIFTETASSVATMACLTPNDTRVINTDNFIGVVSVPVNTMMCRYLKALHVRHHDPFFYRSRKAIGRRSATGIAFEGEIPWDVELVLDDRIKHISKKKRRGRKWHTHDDAIVNKETRS